MSQGSWHCISWSQSTGHRSSVSCRRSPHIQNGPAVQQNLHHELSPEAESYAVLCGFLLSYKEILFSVIQSILLSSFSKLVQKYLTIENYMSVKQSNVDQHLFLPILKKQQQQNTNYFFLIQIKERKSKATALHVYQHMSTKIGQLEIKSLPNTNH